MAGAGDDKREAIAAGHARDGASCGALLLRPLGFVAVDDDRDDDDDVDDKEEDGGGDDDDGGGD